MKLELKLEFKKKSPNRKGKYKSKQKRAIKVQIEKGNKSPNRKGKYKSKQKLEKVNWLKKMKKKVIPKTTM